MGHCGTVCASYVIAIGWGSCVCLWHHCHWDCHQAHSCAAPCRGPAGAVTVASRPWCDTEKCHGGFPPIWPSHPASGMADGSTQKTAGMADGSTPKIAGMVMGSLDLRGITKKTGHNHGTTGPGMADGSTKKTARMADGSTQKVARMADGQGGKPQ